MKLAIVGCRDYNDYDLFRAKCDEFLSSHSVDEIISGGATGADAMAERYAAEHNIKTTIFKADWGRFGKRAGPLRNREIVHAADHVLAFWDLRSAGTRSTILIAREVGKPVDIINIGDTTITPEQSAQQDSNVNKFAYVHREERYKTSRPTGHMIIPAKKK